MDAVHDSSIRPLTSLRFIAALLVFLSHYGGYYNYGRAEQFWQSIFIEGHAGVTIFFVLSGFLITLRYFPAVTERRFSLYDYFLRRAARILPLYWTILALMFAGASLALFQIYAPVPLTNWTLTQGYFYDISTSVIFTGWSLTAEESFYLIAPVILHFCAAFGQDMRAVLSTLLVWVVGLFGIGLIGVWIAQSGSLNQPYGFMRDTSFMIYATLFGRGFNFGVGIFLAWLYLKYRDHLWQHPSSSRKSLILFSLSALGILSAQVAMNIYGGAISGWMFNQFIALFAGFVILSLTCPTSGAARLLNKSLPVYMGHISYALYLLQATPIARILFPILNQSGLALYAVMNGVSAIFYEVIERPGKRFVLRAGAWINAKAVKLRRARA